MSDLEKQVHAVRAAYDDAPPYRDLEVAAVIRAVIDLILPKEAGWGVSREADFNRIIRGRAEAIADKLEEDHDDY